MNESQNKLAKIVQNADTIPLDLLKKEGVEYYKEILSTKPDDLYTETGSHRDITLYTAAIQLLYFKSINTAVAFGTYIKRLEQKSPKTKPKRKQELLSLEAKKAIAEEVKKEITKYKKKKAIAAS